MREIKERIPLQASATSRVSRGRLITFPSRKTGTQRKGRTEDATREASSCNGKVIWLKTITGRGIIRTNTAHGNKTALNRFHPKSRRETPARTMRREKRERNSSAPSWPTINAQSPAVSTAIPSQDGRNGMRARCPRFRQRMNAENKGTKNPCEKFGSFHHCKHK